MRAEILRGPSGARAGCIRGQFPGSPLSYASFATAPAKAGIDACTPRGWRSCFRDWCGDIGDVPRDLAEAALAHRLNATEGVYRRMTAVERRREVMTRYSDWLNDERGKLLAFSNLRSLDDQRRFEDHGPGQIIEIGRGGHYRFVDVGELFFVPLPLMRMV